MWPGLFALLSILLLVAAAFVPGRRAQLALLGAAAFVIAVSWQYLTAIGG